MSLTISPRTRITAAAGVIALAAVGTGFAAFSDSGDVRSTFTSGSLDLKFDANEDGNPTPYVIDFADAGNMTPGDSATYDLVLFNSGTVDATGALALPTVDNTPAAADPALSSSLDLTITDTTAGTELYSGPLAGATFDALDLPGGGTQATGTTLEMTVTMDPAASVQVGGQSVTVTLPFTATQA